MMLSGNDSEDSINDYTNQFDILIYFAAENSILCNIYRVRYLILERLMSSISCIASLSTEDEFLPKWQDVNYWASNEINYSISVAVLVQNPPALSKWCLKVKKKKIVNFKSESCSCY